MTLTEKNLIQFSDKAREMALRFIEQEGVESCALRVAVETSSALDLRYTISLIQAGEVDPRDHLFDAGGFQVAVDRESSKILEGSSVEWVETLNQTGFKVEDPYVRPSRSMPLQGPLAERVKTVIDEDINPAVARHGGEIVLLDVEEAIVYIRMSGGCQGCDMARITLTQGVERMVMAAVPEVQCVVDVTNHGAGTNPYF